MAASAMFAKARDDRAKQIGPNEIKVQETIHLSSQANEAGSRAQIRKNLNASKAQPSVNNATRVTFDSSVQNNKDEEKSINHVGKSDMVFSGRENTEHEQLDSETAKQNAEGLVDIIAERSKKDSVAISEQHAPDKKLPMPRIAGKSKLESLDCFELIEWWVGKSTGTSIQMQNFQEDESISPPNIIKNREEHSKWLGNYIDDWSSAQADRLASNDADLQALNNNIESLAAMAERGDGVQELGGFCCRAAAHLLDLMAAAVLHRGAPAATSESLSSDADISLLLTLMHACSDLAVRIEEFKRFDETEALADLCQTRAAELFRLRPAAAGPAGDSEARECALVAVCANAASLRLLRGRAAEAQAALDLALPHVRDGLDSAAEFHLIRASMLEAQARSVRPGARNEPTPPNHTRLQPTAGPRASAAPPATVSGARDRRSRDPGSKPTVSSPPPLRLGGGCLSSAQARLALEAVEASRGRARRAARFRETVECAQEG